MTAPAWFVACAVLRILAICFSERRDIRRSGSLPMPGSCSCRVDISHWAGPPAGRRAGFSVAMSIRPPESWAQAGLGPPNRRGHGHDSTWATGPRRPMGRARQRRRPSSQSGSVVACHGVEHVGQRKPSEALRRGHGRPNGDIFGALVNPDEVRFSAVAPNRRSHRAARGAIDGTQARGDEHGPDSEA